MSSYLRVLRAWLGQGRKNLRLQSYTSLRLIALSNHLLHLSSLNTTETLMLTLTLFNWKYFCRSDVVVEQCMSLPKVECRLLCGRHSLWILRSTNPRLQEKSSPPTRVIGSVRKLGGSLNLKLSNHLASLCNSGNRWPDAKVDRGLMHYDQGMRLRPSHV
jgi:hypothetical protein